MDGLNIREVTDPQDEALSDFVSLTDVVLRSKHEPEKGMYIAEGATVIRRAIGAGHRPRAFLMAPKWIEALADVLAQFPDVPVLVGDEAMLEDVTGFHVHRGALASMHRPALTPVADLLAACRDGAGARRIAVFEDVVDHTNIGAAIRGAAALGIDAVLVTPRCADPLYRRAVKVSMGTVFQVPWTRIEDWPSAPAGSGRVGGVDLLKELGFTVAALALKDDSVSLDELEANPPDKLALVFGAEGDGLTDSTIAACDMTVRIPMAGGVDSLNVAAASAVAFWAIRTKEVAQ